MGKNGTLTLLIAVVIFSLCAFNALAVAPPSCSITITSPTGGSTVSGTLPITWTATDCAATFKVWYSVDGGAFEVLSHSATSPFNWDTTTVNDSTDYKVRVKENGGGGPVTTSAFTVDNTPVDTTPPVITLSGSSPLDVEFGSGPYADAGATASDNVDGDITGDIVVGGDTVDTNVLGAYVITYDVEDAAGNDATQVTRTVNVVDTTDPIITLLGSTPIDVEFGSVYNDAGATASDNVDGDITGDIVVGGDTVDTNALGAYVITYDVEDASGNDAVQVTRTVNVVDPSAPVITLVGSDPVDVEFGDPYIDDGATALDDVDGDLTESILVGGDTVDTDTLGTYVITYDVSDSSENAAVQVTRTVNVVDTTVPVITLSGSDPVSVNLGDSYEDDGATASDNVDGDISESIVVGGDTVDTDTLGTYVITYDVMDNAGNNATQVTRTVNVVSGSSPVITINGVNPATVTVGNSYEDAGATASDEEDGDLSESIETTNNVDTETVGTYNVTYTVTDSNENTVSEVRTVNVVAAPPGPSITIVGANPATVNVGAEYVDAGATATDGESDMTESLIIVNEVNTSVAGTYNVTYTLNYGEEQSITAVRTVNVVTPPPAPSGGGGGGGGGRSITPQPTSTVTTVPGPTPPITPPTTPPATPPTTGNTQQTTPTGDTLGVVPAAPAEQPDAPAATGLAVSGGTTPADWLVNNWWLVLLLLAALGLGGWQLNKKYGWL